MVKARQVDCVPQLVGVRPGIVEGLLDAFQSQLLLLVYESTFNF